jgi:hypothetical protein
MVGSVNSGAQLEALPFVGLPPKLMLEALLRGANAAAFWWLLSSPATRPVLLTHLRDSGTGREVAHSIVAPYRAAAPTGLLARPAWLHGAILSVAAQSASTNTPLTLTSPVGSTAASSLLEMRLCPGRSATHPDTLGCYQFKQPALQHCRYACAPFRSSSSSSTTNTGWGVWDAAWGDNDQTTPPPHAQPYLRCAADVLRCVRYYCGAAPSLWPAQPRMGHLYLAAALRAMGLGRATAAMATADSATQPDKLRDGVQAVRVFADAALVYRIVEFVY